MRKDANRNRNHRLKPKKYWTKSFIWGIGNRCLRFLRDVGDSPPALCGTALQRNAKFLFWSLRDPFLSDHSPSSQRCHSLRMPNFGPRLLQRLGKPCQHRKKPTNQSCREKLRTMFVKSIEVFVYLLFFCNVSRHCIVLKSPPNYSAQPTDEHHWLKIPPCRETPNDLTCNHSSASQKE